MPFVILHHGQFKRLEINCIINCSFITPSIVLNLHHDLKNHLKISANNFKINLVF